MSSIAKEGLTYLIQAMDIKNITYIDDHFNEDQDEIDKIIGFVKSIIEGGNLDKLNLEFGKQFPDGSSWEAYLRKNWETEEDIDKKRIVEKVSKVSNNPSFKDRIYIPRFEKLLTDIITFSPLTPNQWEKTKTAIISQATKTNKIIILFDKEMGSIDGEKLLLEVLTQNNENIICGLLTYTIEPEEGEWNKWMAIEYEHKERFYPISKMRLDKEDDDSFISGLKLLIYNRPCYELKKVMIDEIEKTNSIAQKAFNEIDIINFEQLIFTSSKIEGVLELDTLLRIYYLYHRDQARKNIYSNTQLTEYSKVIRKLSGNMSNGAFKCKNAWRTQQLELYDNSDFLNKNYIPLGLGDIFKVKENYYILLAQPCDILVRNKDGKRSIEEGIFIKMEKGRPPDISIKKQEIEKLIRDIPEKEKLLEQITIKVNEIEPGYRFFKMMYYDENGNDWYADFQKFFSIKLSELDWCVVNPEGKLKYDKTIKDIGNLTLGWQKRIEIMKTLIDEYEKSGFPTIMLHNRIELTDKEYDIQRVKRLHPPHSINLLNQFSYYISRIPIDHDLTK